MRRAVSGAFHTIIISANADRAIEAFEYGVLDFVAKPFNRERLERAFQRALSGTEATAGTAAKVLAVRKREGILLVRIDDVVYIKAAGPYAELYLRDSRTELHNKSLDGLMALLPPAFERTHKSYIVRLSEIVRLIPHEGSRYELELKSSVRLPVGRSRYATLRARIIP